MNSSRSQNFLVWLLAALLIGAACFGLLQATGFSADQAGTMAVGVLVAFGFLWRCIGMRRARTQA